MSNKYEKTYFQNLNYFKEFHNEVYLQLTNFTIP